MKSRYIAICGVFFACALLAGGCDDDSGEDEGADAAAGAGGQGGGAGGQDGGSAGEGGSATADPVYLLSVDIVAPDTRTTYAKALPSLETDSVDLQGAAAAVGGGWAFTRLGSVFLGEQETFQITRYEVDGQGLRKGETVSFAERGVSELTHAMVCSETRGFLVNPGQYEMIEWNPQDMTITRSYDMRAALERAGWGVEMRRYPVCAGGKVYFYWTYTNERTEFIDNLTVGIFDMETGTTQLIEDDTCSCSSGYGGYQDEAGDFYAFADNFGSFTLFNDAPKPACVRRIRAGATEFDPDFRVDIAPAMGGLRPFGLWYAGGGVAYTSAMDTSRVGEFESPFEFVFAPIHTRWRVDVANGTAREVPGVERGGVGLGGFSVEGRALLPSTTGEVEVFDVMTAESTVISVDPATDESRVAFKVPGEVYTIDRIR